MNKWTLNSFVYASMISNGSLQWICSLHSWFSSITLLNWCKSYFTYYLFRFAAHTADINFSWHYIINRKPQAYCLCERLPSSVLCGGKTLHKAGYLKESCRRLQLWTNSGSQKFIMDALFFFLNKQSSPSYAAGLLKQFEKIQRF